MTLNHSPITKKWPAAHPDRLQLYSLPTPNGVKVAIALEALGLPYEVHKVSFDSDDQLSPEFLSLNPNNKIPDIATFPWVRNLVGFYGAGELVESGKFGSAKRVLDAFLARPAVQRGLTIPKKP